MVVLGMHCFVVEVEDFIPLARSTTLAMDWVSTLSGSDPTVLKLGGGLSSIVLGLALRRPNPPSRGRLGQSPPSTCFIAHSTTAVLPIAQLRETVAFQLDKRPCQVPQLYRLWHRKPVVITVPDLGPML